MLVNDILDYSKIESGKLRLEEIGFRIGMVVNESLATLEHLANNKGIELISEIDKQLEGVIVKGDPVRLKQILINLAGNGVKFTTNGYVKIGVGIDEDHGKENAILKLTVEDTGKGIAPEKLQTIFEGFDQEDTSISRRFGGTGLGLTISKKLVEMLGGTIEVQSKVGEGSEFSVSLPCIVGEKDEYSGKFDPERVEIDLKEKSLLLIDDDRMNHLLLRPFLERWGLELESCYNGDDGIKKGATRFYDFVLVDLQMPGKSGFEVVEAIRDNDSACKGSAVILCTANAMITKTKDPALQKVDGMLLKPFKEYEVAAMLAGIDKEDIVGSGVQNENLPYTLSNFKTFAGDDPKLLREFLQSFIETNQHHIDLLEQYFEAKDFLNVGDTAHKMKNTFGQLEASRAMFQLKELEKLVEGSQPEKLIRKRIEETRRLAADLFDQLAIEIKKLEEEQSQTSKP